jgi:hypothetical protein
MGLRFAALLLAAIAPSAPAQGVQEAAFGETYRELVEIIRSSPRAVARALAERGAAHFRVLGGGRSKC